MCVCVCVCVLEGGGGGEGGRNAVHSTKHLLVLMMILFSTKLKATWDYAKHVVGVIVHITGKLSG